MPWLLETKLRPWEGVIAHDPIMNFMPDALLGRSSQILQRTRLMANSIRELWLTRREQQPRYVMCTPSARDRLRMRVCRARASRALTSVVHSFCECILSWNTLQYHVEQTCDMMGVMPASRLFITRA